MEPKEIRQVVQKTVRRMRIQLMLERAATSAMISVALVAFGLCCLKTGLIGNEQFSTFVVGAATVLALGLTWGWAARVSTDAAVSRVDRANGLNDALRSARQFAGSRYRVSTAERKFMEAEMDRAAQAAGIASARKAAPIRWPRDTRPLVGLALFAFALFALEVPVEKARAGNRGRPAVDTGNLAVASAILDDHLEQVRELRVTVRKRKAPRLAKLLWELERFLEDLKLQRLDEAAFVRRFQKWMKRKTSYRRELARQWDQGPSRAAAALPGSSVREKERVMEFANVADRAEENLRQLKQLLVRNGPARLQAPSRLKEFLARAGGPARRPARSERKMGKTRKPKKRPLKKPRPPKEKTPPPPPQPPRPPVPPIPFPTPPGDVQGPPGGPPAPPGPNPPRDPAPGPGDGDGEETDGPGGYSMDSDGDETQPEADRDGQPADHQDGPATDRPTSPKTEAGQEPGRTRGGSERSNRSLAGSTSHKKRIRARKGEGPSAQQVLRSAGQRGFFTAGYRNLFLRYRLKEKEVMARQDVPAGYRYYVRKYFMLIRPRK